MFKILYSMSIFFYFFVAKIFSFFNCKAKLLVDGRKNIWEIIEKSDASKSKNIWFHVSSLGEFEQARPLIEKIKNQYPHYKVILTFFSPSGYEIRKNYEKADYIWYLPIDTPKNARRFIEFINPEKVFFVKYDFWFFYLNTLSEKNIETFLVSGIFRKNQFFFKRIGKQYAKLLDAFTHFFVQNQNSKVLLNSLSYTNVSVVGDTRFDRVIKIAENSTELPDINRFVGDNYCIISGSSWPEDEKLFLRYVNESVEQKFIIAPHNINEENIISLLQGINRPVIRFSKIANQDLTNYPVLIIDNIGMLSSVYKYGKVAYIGGGFGTGIHNVIEAAVYGMPVVFGPKYKKFQEAKDLIDIKAAYSIADYQTLEHTLNLLVKEDSFLENVSEKAKDYVYKNKGATEKIFNYVFDN